MLLDTPSVMALLFLVALVFGCAHMKSFDDNDEVSALLKRDVACYGSLGCFGTDAPFISASRPIALVPEDPDKVLTKYLLYTREARTKSQDVDARYPETSKSIWTHFKERPTKILIHGFLDTPTLTDLWQELKDELLIQGDYNVIIVDWSHGNQAPYDQACANARVVGAQISELVNYLTNASNVAPSNFHIIGHSLGAHVAGYAGERIPGLGRITGLDPAGPYFENTDEVVRLDASDAVFVDAIHTDATNLLLLGLGTKTPSGHADFYPNSGHDQPGCTRDPVTNVFENGLISGIEESLACSHVRAVRFFTESVNTQCPFMGFPCVSEEDFENNLCHSCTEDGCAPLGLHADKHIPPEGKQIKYFLSTAQKKPFCQYHLTVTLKLTAGQGGDEKGTLHLTVAGDKTTTSAIALTGEKDPITLKPGKTYTFYVGLPANFGNVRSASFTWTHMAGILDPLNWDILGLRHPKLYVDEIDIHRDEDGLDVHLCASGQSIETGRSLTVSTEC